MKKKIRALALEEVYKIQEKYQGDIYITAMILEIFIANCHQILMVMNVY